MGCNYLSLHDIPAPGTKVLRGFMTIHTLSAEIFSWYPVYKGTIDGRGNPSKMPMKYTLTSWHGNAFRITAPLWGNPPMTGGFPHKGPVIRSFGASLSLNNLLDKNRVAGNIDTMTPMLNHSNIDALSKHSLEFVQVSMQGIVDA